MHQTDLDKNKFGYPTVDDASPGNPKHVECATIYLCWRLVAGGWWLEVGDWSWCQEVSGWLECVSSVRGLIVKGLIF